MPENSFDLPPLPKLAQPEPQAAKATSRRAVLTLGAAAGAALFLLPGRKAQADTGRFIGNPDHKDLRFLAQLQFLQADFFDSAALSSTTEAFSKREAATLNLIAKQESEQARWFTAARQIFPPGVAEQPSQMNLPASRPIINYRIPANNFATRDAFYAEAIRIKEIAVGVFHEAVGSGMGGDFEWVQAIASLAGVQNRHLALLKELSGADPFTPFVAPLSFAEAQRQLTAYKFEPEAL